jgi:small subunit ribosomal protein S6
MDRCNAGAFRRKSDTQEGFIVAKIQAYESMVILSPGLTKEEADKLVDKYAEVIKSQGGEVTKIDRMGKRKIAYEMNKQSEGTYALLVFNSPGTAVAELERQLRLSDEVLKFQTIRQEPEYRPVPKKRQAPAGAAA